MIITSTKTSIVVSKSSSLYDSKYFIFNLVNSKGLFRLENFLLFDMLPYLSRNLGVIVFSCISVYILVSESNLGVLMLPIYSFIDID